VVNCEVVLAQHFSLNRSTGLYTAVDAGVIIPHQHTFAGKQFQQPLIVDIELQALGGAVQVGTIDEKRNPFLRVKQHL
jgi:hypothetical protein